MTFTLTLSRTSTRPVTVRWSTAKGTARSGSDYVSASGTLTFAAGQTGKTVTVRVKGDRTREATETFHLRLSRPTGATIADGNALGSIVNDD
jgi:chitinase